ncbi:hypothetical protein TCAL_16858 [Tigriopus californicus]|uniref:Uncharacterized protein n=1 Tax=Tigriopus californicus TaxID=6832 RepID=A0A553PBU4_TIGCA|nr:hypothetical protein TCAL_16858 [Tigriopus californicus]
MDSVSSKTAMGRSDTAGAVCPRPAPITSKNCRDRSSQSLTCCKYHSGRTKLLVFLAPEKWYWKRRVKGCKRGHGRARERPHPSVPSVGQRPQTLKLTTQHRPVDAELADGRGLAQNAIRILTVRQHPGQLILDLRHEALAQGVDILSDEIAEMSAS